MAEERDAPTRAQIESVMWVLNQGQSTEQERRNMLTAFLHDRGLGDREVDQVLGDLDSYENWVVDEPVEEADAERSTPADNAGTGAA